MGSIPPSHPLSLQLEPWVCYLACTKKRDKGKEFKCNEGADVYAMIHIKYVLEYPQCVKIITIFGYIYVLRGYTIDMFTILLGK